MRATERAVKPFLDRRSAILGMVGLLAACHGLSDAPRNEPVRSVPVRIETGIGLVMVRIEADTFRMGSSVGEPGRRDDETLHTVTISRPYWIGETEVTQQQWNAVMGAKNWGGDYEKVGASQPATSVSWHDAVAFCDRLTEMERAAGRLPDGYRYGLPSEAEWEYACRGGSKTAFCHGDDEGRLTEFAVVGKKFEKGTAADPVRTKKANAFGLHDMHGNVWEWCADHANYDDKRLQVLSDTYSGTVTDPLSVSGPKRVRRGGCWNSVASVCRSAFRYANDPSFAFDYLGFRPALLARSSGK